MHLLVTYLECGGETTTGGNITNVCNMLNQNISKNIG